MWPQGVTLRPIVVWPGVMTKRRYPSQFSAPIRSTLKLLHTELAQIKARDVVMQIALEESQFRRDGYPRAGAVAEHPGVILSMNTPDGALSFPCDTFSSWEENLRAIVLTMERLRAIKRYGVATNGQQYDGWKALDAPRAAPAMFTDATAAFLWITEYIGWEPDGDVIVETDPDAYQDALRQKRMGILRRAQRKAHPDHGGDAADFARVSLAEAAFRADDWI